MTDFDMQVSQALASVLILMLLAVEFVGWRQKWPRRVKLAAVGVTAIAIIWLFAGWMVPVIITTLGDGIILILVFGGGTALVLWQRKQRLPSIPEVITTTATDAVATTAATAVASVSTPQSRVVAFNTIDDFGHLVLEGEKHIVLALRTSDVTPNQDLMTQVVLALGETKFKLLSASRVPNTDRLAKALWKAWEENGRDSRHETIIREFLAGLAPHNLKDKARSWPYLIATSVFIALRAENDDDVDIIDSVLALGERIGTLEEPLIFGLNTYELVALWSSYSNYRVMNLEIDPAEVECAADLRIPASPKVVHFGKKFAGIKTRGTPAYPGTKMYFQYYAVHLTYLNDVNVLCRLAATQLADFVLSWTPRDRVQEAERIRHDNPILTVAQQALIDKYMADGSPLELPGDIRVMIGVRGPSLKKVMKSGQRMERLIRKKLKGAEPQLVEDPALVEEAYMAFQPVITTRVNSPAVTWPVTQLVPMFESIGEVEIPELKPEEVIVGQSDRGLVIRDFFYAKGVLRHWAILGRSGYGKTFWFRFVLLQLILKMKHLQILGFNLKPGLDWGDYLLRVSAKSTRTVILRLETSASRPPTLVVKCRTIENGVLTERVSDDPLVFLREITVHNTRTLHLMVEVGQLDALRQQACADIAMWMQAWMVDHNEWYPEDYTINLLEEGWRVFEPGNLLGGHGVFVFKTARQLMGLGVVITQGPSDMAATTSGINHLGTQIGEQVGINAIFKLNPSSAQVVRDLGVEDEDVPQIAAQQELGYFLLVEDQRYEDLALYVTPTMHRLLKAEKLVDVEEPAALAA